jgi:regulatory protein
MFKITEISPQQKGNLLNVFVNGEFSFSADSGFIVEEDVFVGKALDDQGLSDLKRSAEIRKAVRHALYLLEHRDFSKKELSKRLEEKGYDEECSVLASEKIAEIVGDHYLGLHVGLVGDNAKLCTMRRKLLQHLHHTVVNL